MPTARAIIKAHYRRMGKRGGKARAESLTPQDRTRIASDAAKTRWANYYAKQDAAKVAGA